MAGKTFSPLRYPGGKNKLSNYVSKLILSNKLDGCTYIEPYTGGGAVAIKLLFNSIVDNIIINDYDKSIYALWYSILNYTDELCSLILSTEINMENWHIQKNIQKNKEDSDLLTLGFSTLFLNRTNISGIIKAGVIGGLNQTGNYKMDCRFNKKDIIDKIIKIASQRKNIQLYNLDTLNLIENIIPNIKHKKFIFFDPPYYKKGASLYVNYYTHNDHIELKNSIEKIKNSYWIITYDNEKEIESIYKEFRQKKYNLTYTAQKKYLAKEIMIYSDNLVISKPLKNIF
ncbi:DNA adenine methylase [Clostridioides difficile]|nr:DNA adenine methylase [Clostridioides difficile]MDN9434576.1 DNA adenine methylase [Clostridioides difficile]